MTRLLVLLSLSLTVTVDAFAPRRHAVLRRGPVVRADAPSEGSGEAVFKLDVDLGDQGVAKMKFKPLLEDSTVVVVKYAVPFGLDAGPEDGKVLVTKDGAGGEKVGDILRFTTFWSMKQIEGSGLASTIGNFGGAPKWGVGLFDVAKANSFQEVVDALLTNEKRRTDTVTLIFERPKEESS